jgi:hypothetical protein
MITTLSKSRSNHVKSADRSITCGHRHFTCHGIRFFLQRQGTLKARNVRIGRKSYFGYYFNDLCFLRIFKRRANHAGSLELTSASAPPPSE